MTSAGSLVPASTTLNWALRIGDVVSTVSQPAGRLKVNSLTLKVVGDSAATAAKQRNSETSTMARTGAARILFSPRRCARPAPERRHWISNFEPRTLNFDLQLIMVRYLLLTDTRPAVERKSPPLLIAPESCRHADSHWFLPKSCDH